MRLHPTRWNKIESDISQSQALDLGLSLSLSNLLYSRFETKEAIRDFLSPALYDQPMSDELAAAERIAQAIQQGERIGIFGDYDVDGVTSSAIWTRFLRHHGLEPVVYLPSRYREGYGLNAQSVGLVSEIDLLITVDCGITSVGEVDILKQQGIDVIVTDHHEPAEELPDTYVVNPKLEGYPFPDLAGVGVAYKLLRRLQRLGFDLPLGLIELTALGTVADVMPLVGENRWIVRQGLKALPDTSVMGLGMLMRQLQLSGDIRATDLAFRIGPLLNAAGRMDSPWPAYQLLTETDPLALNRIIQELISANQARRQATDAILNELKKRITHVPPMIIEKGEDWLGGVLGLAASKACEVYRRPVILLQEGESLKGSGRSIGDFSLLNSLKHSQEHLVRYGGHQVAAGLELSRDDFESFKQAILAYTEDHLREDDKLASYSYYPIELADIRLEFLDQLELLEPFGAGNEAPIFRLDGLKLQTMRLMGKNKTAAALEFLIGSRTLRLITFSVVTADWLVGERYDLLFRLERNNFQGVTQLQLMLQDYRLSEFKLTPRSPIFLDEVERMWQLVLSYDPKANQAGAIDLLKAYHLGEAPAERLGNLAQSDREDLDELVRHLPTRPDLVEGYKELKYYSDGVDLMAHPDPLRLCLQVKLFESLGLLTYTKNDFLVKPVWHDQGKKLDLFQSDFYRKSQRILEDYHELDRHHSGS